MGLLFFFHIAHMELCLTTFRDTLTVLDTPIVSRTNHGLLHLNQEVHNLHFLLPPNPKCHVL